MEVLRWTGPQANVAIGGTLLVVLAPALVLLFKTGEAGSRPSSSFYADRPEPLSYVIDKIAKDPALARFVPLLTSGGYYMTVEDVKRQSARYDALLSVPHRAPYAAILLRGGNPTDETIDYWAFPNRTVLCEHFTPIELAARRQNVAAIYATKGRQTLDVSLDYDALEIRPPLRIAQREELDHKDYWIYRYLECGHCGDELHDSCAGAKWPPAS